MWAEADATTSREMFVVDAGLCSVFYFAVRCVQHWMDGKF